MFYGKLASIWHLVIPHNETHSIFYLYIFENEYRLRQFVYNVTELYVKTCFHAKPVNLLMMKNAVKVFAGCDRRSYRQTFQTGEQKNFSTLFRMFQSQAQSSSFHYQFNDIISFEERSSLWSTL